MEHHPLWHEEAGVPLLHAFLEILSGNGLEYDSDDINCYVPSHMCYHINGEDPLEEAPRAHAAGPESPLLHELPS
jgi:hypothetical protein